MNSTLPPSQVLPYSLQDLAKYFLWLGSTGFGGPLSRVGFMQQDLTEKRQWISRQDFLNGLALASLCPGPLATQLAIYIGWLHFRIFGATVIFIAFTLPSFLIVLVLAISYSHYSDVGWTQSALKGLSACVIVIVARNAFKLSKLIVARDHWLWGLFGVNIFLAVATNIQAHWALMTSGLLVWVIRKPPRFISPASLYLPVGIGMGSLSSYSLTGKLFLYFFWTGSVIFGSGYAIIPFIHEGVVHTYNWLDERQFLDAISIGMVIPGPVVLSVAFIGYLVAGIQGSLAAALGVFLPCYLFIVILAPYFNRIAHHEGVRAFVQGVTVAAAGAIAGVALLLGKSSVINWFSLGIIAVTSLALFYFKKIPEQLWLGVAAALGILLKV